MNLIFQHVLICMLFFYSVYSIEQVSTSKHLLDKQDSNVKTIQVHLNKGQKKEFHKENKLKKIDDQNILKSVGDKGAHQEIDNGKSNSKLKSKKSDELGHDEGKKTASKTRKKGDELKENWDRGSGFIKQWNWDKGSKNKNGYNHEDEGKINKYNKAYKAETGEKSKGKYINYKKQNSGWKDNWHNTKWNSNKGINKLNSKHGGNLKNHNFNKKRHNEYYQNGWDNEKGWGWGEIGHNGHKSSYEWNF